MRLLLSALTATLFGFSANAATIDLSVGVATFWPSGPGQRLGNNESQNTADFPFASIRETSALSNSLFFTEATSLAFGNGDRGVLRSLTSARSDPQSSAFAESAAFLTENYTVRGSGTATARFRVDGTVSVIRGFHQAQGFVCLFCNSSRRVIETFSFDENGFFDIDLSVSSQVFSINQPTEIQVGWGFSSLVSGVGTVDLSNTGRAFIEFSDSLAGTPDDANFLSDPAYLDNNSPTPVPLPAGVLLLLTGLAGFNFFGRSKVIVETR